jgi:hypothetical protein
MQQHMHPGVMQEEHDEVMLDLNQHQAGGSGQQHDLNLHGQLSDAEHLRNMSIATVNDTNAELGLAALRDSPEGVKPFYPYSTLIRKSYAVRVVDCFVLAVGVELGLLFTVMLP